MYNLFLLSRFLENLIFAQNNEILGKIKIKCRSGNAKLLIDFIQGPNGCIALGLASHQMVKKKKHVGLGWGVGILFEK